MGKTTLLAKFVLDGLRDPAGCFPFAYIDFERPTLSIQEPLTLIAEVARQLGIQFPAHRAELDALAHECQEATRSQREGQERVSQLQELATTRAVLGRRSSQQFQSLAAGRETDLIRRLAEVLRRAVAERKGGAHAEDPPFALVVDSFEEAQYRGSPVVGRMVAIYLSFQSIYPRMRLIVSGRAPVEHPAKTVESLDIELGELDPAAAVGLLTSCGVKDPEVAGALADRVGGHPLSLKLAARAATLAGAGAEPTGELIRSLPERRHQVFRRVDQLLVQGILYDRILSHIGDEGVRRLARPGLVLRVITPEIIEEVLAEPCGLRVATPDAARALFAEFSRLDLVEPARPDAVRYRSDVRAIMLRLPGGDRTAVMRAVERRAVEHYAARDGLEARAEEIYHRLRLDENPRSVEERWLPGVERFLAGAQQDMTPRAAGLLTARLGGATPDQVAAGADQEDWERIAAREVEDLLAQGYAQAAFERLGRRRPWTPCSPLHALFAEALNRLGRQEEARRATADAVDAAERAGCGERRLELLLLSARLSEEAGDLPGAGRALRVAEDVAVGLGQDLEAMGALLARARLTAGADGEADRQLAERLRQLPDAVLADRPVLVRAVASQIYDRAPGALDHALEVVGLPADDETLDTLGAAMRRATGRQPALLGRVMEILDEAADRPGSRPTVRRPGSPGFCGWPGTRQPRHPRPAAAGRTRQERGDRRRGGRGHGRGHRGPYGEPRGLGAGARGTYAGGRGGPRGRMTDDRLPHTRGDPPGAGRRGGDRAGRPHRPAAAARRHHAPVPRHTAAASGARPAGALRPQRDEPGGTAGGRLGAAGDLAAQRRRRDHRGRTAHRLPEGPGRGGTEGGR